MYVAQEGLDTKSHMSTSLQVKVYSEHEGLATEVTCTLHKRVWSLKSWVLPYKSRCTLNKKVQVKMYVAQEGLDTKSHMSTSLQVNSYVEQEGLDTKSHMSMGRTREEKVLRNQVSASVMREQGLHHIVSEQIRT